MQYYHALGIAQNHREKYIGMGGSKLIIYNNPLINMAPIQCTAICILRGI